MTRPALTRDVLRRLNVAWHRDDLAAVMASAWFTSFCESRGEKPSRKGVRRVLKRFGRGTILREMSRPIYGEGG